MTHFRQKCRTFVFQQKMANVNTFAEKTLELLNLEREAEITEAKAFCENADNDALEKKGVCLRKLAVLGRRTGLFGRTLLTFGKSKTARNAVDSSLPAHCITPGDIVGLSYSSGDNNVSELSSGIVLRVLSSSIVVAFDESLDSQSFDEDALMRLTRLANNITHKRMKRALESICKPASFPCTRLIEVSFGVVPFGEPLNLANLPGQSDNETCKKDIFFNPNLNESQKTAVQFALTRRDIGVIHGPPGTGKTTTVVEVIVQAVKNCQLKVLACAPSNIAVDNIVERLAKFKIKAVRLGHPARVMETTQGYSLDAILDSSDGTAIVKDVRRDIDMTQSKLKSSRNAGERSRLRTEIKSLRRELREREEKALKQILNSADVILSTNVSASDDGPLKHVARDHFDLVVIDEAAQALEASCWIPLLWASRCILAGDHHQLPPTIVSREAAKKGLEKTLMERVVKLLGDSVVHMLTTQYRMNETIMQWSSEQLYDGRLSADVSVAQHLLRDLPQVRDTEVTSVPLLMIDTAGCDLYELQTPEEESKGNEGEAEVVVQHVEALINSGVKHKDIGIITPYNLQVELLRSRLSTKYPALEIKSVDGFQGREKEAIVISLVRSNNKGEVGFLAENRRINVAVTRARRHLTIVGDSSTISRDPFLNSLVEYIGDRGEVWSAEHYRSGITGDSVLARTRAKTGAQTGTKPKNKNTVKVNKEKNKDGTRNKSKSKSDSRVKKEDSEGRTCRSAKHIHRTTGDDHEHVEEVGIKVDRERRRRDLEDKIKGFVNDDIGSEFAFPANLSSEERFMVHCIAEELGLQHVSRGTGSERFIVVTKTTSSDVPVENHLVSEADEDATSSSKEEDKGKPASCPSCGTSVSSSNLRLHEVRCQRERQQAQSISAKQATNHDKTKPTKPSRKSAKSCVSKVPVKKDNPDQSGDNLDELLAEFKRKDTECALSGCKASILTVGQKCRCCAKVFCLGHHIPEVHGCTQAAREHARRELHAKAAGNHTRPSSKTATKKAHLQRKLEKKLKDFEGQRKAKQNSADKK